MLTGLRLGNFKAFGETQNIPIKPLTLIFGANSAGKSSIIQGLLLARHANETGNLDMHKTKIAGDAVDLGGFRQYVHRRDTNKQVEWGMTLDLSQNDIGDFNPSYRAANYSSWGSSTAYGAFKMLSQKLTMLSIVAQISKQNADAPIPLLKNYEIYADSTLLASFCRDEDGRMHRQYINYKHPLFKMIWDNIKEQEDAPVGAWNANNNAREDYEDFFEDYDDDVIAAGMDAFIASGLYTGAFLPNKYVRLPVHFVYMAGVAHEDWRQSYEACIDADKEFAKREDAQSVIASAEAENADTLTLYRHFVEQGYKAQCQIEDVVSRIVEYVASIVSWQLEGVDYIAPLRVVPSRHFASLDNQHSSWYAGGYQWDNVRRDSKVRDRVNLWLGKMKSPYQLQVRRYTSEDGRADAIEELILHDQRFDTYVSPKDVGFGISQVLPVLVSAYASEKQVIAIEQPEIHLHPALQAELGDVFIESALGKRKNTFLLETHSEHLILRIMRRMRDTVRGTLPEGMPPVRPEDVAILYVDRKDDDSTSVVSVLELDEEGQLLDPWPGGFFEEGFNERFA